MLYVILQSADDVTLYSMCDQLASKLDSNLPDRVDWGRKWPVDHEIGKAQLVSFDHSNVLSLLKKAGFKILGLPFSYKLNWGLLQCLYY